MWTLGLRIYCQPIIFDVNHSMQVAKFCTESFIKYVLKVLLVKAARYFGVYIMICVHQNLTHYST
jgi:3-deoxy-D-manno-octulosonic acid (KDO) 8-phosphate synthase